MTKLGVIINEGKVLGGGLEELRAALADLGHPDPLWYEVPKSKKAPKKVRKLVDKGVDRILVWGGDGTVRRCIHTLLDDGVDDVAIGILPAGTANLLARNLGIPVDLREAVEIAVHGDPRPLDVGMMNDEHFAVMAGTGFDAVMIRDSEENDLKDRFGRLGYVIAGARHSGVSPARAVIEVDGRPWFKGSASCVIVANVGTILGGLEAFPDASPTDGKLELGVVRARSKTDWLRLLTSAALGRTDATPLADTVTVDEAVIRLDRTMPWEVDGGDRDRANEYVVRCLPGAIRVCQPWEV